MNASMLAQIRIQIQIQIQIQILQVPVLARNNRSQLQPMNLPLANLAHIYCITSRLRNSK